MVKKNGEDDNKESLQKDLEEKNATIEKLRAEIDEDIKIIEIYKSRDRVEINKRIAKELEARLAEIKTQWEEREKELEGFIESLGAELKKQEYKALEEKGDLLRSYEEQLSNKDKGYKVVVQEKDRTILELKDVSRQEVERLEEKQTVEKETWLRTLQIKETESKRLEAELKQKVVDAQLDLEKREHEMQEVLDKLRTELKERDEKYELEKKILIENKEVIEKEKLKAINETKKGLNEVLLQKEKDIQDIKSSFAEETKKKEKIEVELKAALNELQKEIKNQSERYLDEKENIHKEFLEKLQEKEIEVKNIIVQRNEQLKETIDYWQKKFQEQVTKNKSFVDNLKKKETEIEGNVNTVNARVLTLERKLVEVQTALIESELIRKGLEKNIKEGVLNQDQLLQEKEISKKEFDENILKKEKEMSLLIEEKKSQISRLENMLKEEEKKRKFLKDENEKDINNAMLRWQDALAEKDAQLEKIKAGKDAEIKDLQKKFNSEKKTLEQLIKNKEKDNELVVNDFSAKMNNFQLVWETKEQDMKLEIAGYKEKVNEKENLIKEYEMKFALHKESFEKQKDTTFHDLEKKYLHQLEEKENEREKLIVEFQATLEDIHRKNEETKNIFLTREKDLQAKIIKMREESSLYTSNISLLQDRISAFELEKSNIEKNYEEEKAVNAQLKKDIELIKVSREKEIILRNKLSEEISEKYEEQFNGERESWKVREKEMETAIEELKKELSGKEQRIPDEVMKTMQEYEQKSAKKDEEISRIVRNYQEEIKVLKSQLENEKKNYLDEREKARKTWLELIEVKNREADELRKKLEDQRQEEEAKWLQKDDEMHQMIMKLQEKIINRENEFKTEKEILQKKLTEDMNSQEELLKKEIDNANYKLQDIQNEFNQKEEGVFKQVSYWKTRFERQMEKEKTIKDSFLNREKQTLNKLDEVLSESSNITRELEDLKMTVVKLKEEKDEAARRLGELKSSIEGQLKEKEEEKNRIKILLEFKEKEFKRILTEKDNNIQEIKNRITGDLQKKEDELFFQNKRQIEELEEKNKILTVSYEDLLQKFSKLQEEWSKKEKEYYSNTEKLTMQAREQEQRLLEQRFELENTFREKLVTKESEWQKALKDQYVNMKANVIEAERRVESLQAEVRKLNQQLNDIDLSEKDKVNRLFEKIEAQRVQMNVKEEEIKMLKEKISIREIESRDLLARKEEEVQEARAHVEEIKMEMFKSHERFREIEKEFKVEINNTIVFYEERIKQNEPKYKTFVELKEKEIEKLNENLKRLKKSFEDAEKQKSEISAQFLSELGELRKSSYQEQEEMRTIMYDKINKEKDKAHIREEKLEKQIRAIKEENEPLLWKLKERISLLEARLQTRKEELEEDRKVNVQKIKEIRYEFEDKIKNLKNEMLSKEQEYRQIIAELLTKEKMIKEMLDAKNSEFENLDETYKSKLKFLELKHLREIESWSNIVDMKENLFKFSQMSPEEMNK